MGRIFGNWRILAAALFSAVLIVGAYLLARSVGTPPSAQASEETALLQAIATKDSDADGLPDWEEQLYGTDPKNPDTRHLGMTDGEAVAKGLIIPKAIADIKVATSTQSVDATMYAEYGLPPPPAEGTLTAAFAKNFFMIYMNARAANGGDLSESQLADVQKQTLDSLIASIVTAPNFKSIRDLTVSGSGPEALRAFAAAAEAVLLANTNNASKSEIAYLTDAVQNNDTSALDYIASIAKAYRDSSAGLAALSVPKELVADHLLLTNSVMRIGQIIADFARVNDDPLATMLALGQYSQAIIALGTAFLNIGNIYKTAGISLSEDTPGAAFVSLSEIVAPKP